MANHETPGAVVDPDALTPFLSANLTFAHTPLWRDLGIIGVTIFAWSQSGSRQNVWDEFR